MNEPFLPIVTERLIIRPMRPDDAEAVCGYRNQPHVQYQDWELPFPLEAAVQLIEEAGMHDGPVRGDWAQMAIDFEGSLAGDVAVGLDADGEIAAIGITLSEGLQGRGIAREAMRAVIDKLFTVVGVHRVEASVDPRNASSIRMVTAVGFVAEGVSRQSYKVRGVWTDDARYGLLRTDARP